MEKMKDIIFIPDRKNPKNQTVFRLDEKLWNKIFEEIAFLAESGVGQVRFSKQLYTKDNK